MELSLSGKGQGYCVLYCVVSIFELVMMGCPILESQGQVKFPTTPMVAELELFSLGLAANFVQISSDASTRRT